jgi:hypothetical protein
VSFVKSRQDVTFSNLCKDISRREGVPQRVQVLSCAGKNLRGINLPHYLATLSQRCSPAAPELHISVSIALRGGMAGSRNKVTFVCSGMRQLGVMTAGFGDRDEIIIRYLHCRPARRQKATPQSLLPSMLPGRLQMTLQCKVLSDRCRRRRAGSHRRVGNGRVALRPPTPQVQTTALVSLLPHKRRLR